MRQISPCWPKGVRLFTGGGLEESLGEAGIGSADGGLQFGGIRRVGRVVSNGRHRQVGRWHQSIGRHTRRCPGQGGQQIGATALHLT